MSPLPSKLQQIKMFLNFSIKQRYCTNMTVKSDCRERNCTTSLSALCLFVSHCSDLSLGIPKCIAKSFSCNPLERKGANFVYLSALQSQPAHEAKYNDSGRSGKTAAGKDIYSVHERAQSHGAVHAATGYHDVCPEIQTATDRKSPDDRQTHRDKFH